MICLKPKSEKQPHKNAYLSMLAELSALHELSALDFAEDLNELARETLEKVTRLFGTRRFAMLSGIPPNQQLIISSGFKSFGEVTEELAEADQRDNQLVLTFNPDQKDQTLMFFEQRQPIDDRIRRLYNVLASRLEDRLRTIQQGKRRKQAEQALRESEKRNRALLNSIPDLMFVYDHTGTYLDYHASDPSLLGAPPEQFIGKSIQDVLPPPVAKAFLEGFAHTRTKACTKRIEYELDIAGIIRHFEGRITPLDENRLLVIVRDMTEQKIADAEREILQAQLSQAQKMESIGRLAGGIAHDFNNMLGAILGNAELAMDSLDSREILLGHLHEIQKAGERSANLTRQLLAFARRQTVAPQQLDINQAIESMLKMLQCLIGEHIELEWISHPEAGKVSIDPSQLDQILVNLCVNARDAIDNTGKIQIGTDPISVTGESSSALGKVAPGSFVRLTVKDTGKGMDRATLGHIFEPFYTTKGMTEGTGLGLASVYGIIQQNNGFVEVSSEPGRGTTFEIFLPQVAESGKAVPLPPKPGAATQTTDHPSD